MIWRRRTHGRVYCCLKCVVIILQGQKILLTYRRIILKRFFTKRSEAVKWTCSLGTWICKCRCKDGAKLPEFYKSGSSLSSSLMSESRIDAMSSKKLRLKVSHYRPGHALKVPGVEAFRIPRQSLHDGGKGYRTTHQAPLSPAEMSLILISAGG